MLSVELIDALLVSVATCGLPGALPDTCSVSVKEIESGAANTPATWQVWLTASVDRVSVFVEGL